MPRVHVLLSWLPIAMVALWAPSCYTNASTFVRTDDVSGTHTAVSFHLANNSAPIINPDRLRDFKHPTNRSHLTSPTTTSASIRQSGLQGVANVAATSSLSPVAALRGFSLRFENGDHKLTRMQILTQGRYAEVAYHDQDRNDPYSVAADWQLFDTGEAGEVSAFGSGQFDIPIPPGPEAHTLVLRGFAFQRANRSDANVRAIGIRLDQTQPRARVMLLDDQGQDFRGLESVVGASFGAVAVPFGALIGSTATLVESVSRLPPPARRRPYAVTIQYAWLPNVLFERNGAVSGTRAEGHSGRQPDGISLLQGFEFAFGNGDHHLLALSVFDTPARLVDDLRLCGAGRCGEPRQTGRSAPQLFPVIFQDSNLDDPMQWYVEYVQLAEDIVRP